MKTHLLLLKGKAKCMCLSLKCRVGSYCYINTGWCIWDWGYGLLLFMTNSTAWEQFLQMMFLICHNLWAAWQHSMCQGLGDGLSYKYHKHLVHYPFSTGYSVQFVDGILIEFAVYTVIFFSTPALQLLLEGSLKSGCEGCVMKSTF